MSDKLILARYKPTGQEQQMLYSTFNNLKNKDDWEYLGDVATPEPAPKQAAPQPLSRVSQPKKKGCNCRI